MKSIQYESTVLSKIIFFAVLVFSSCSTRHYPVQPVSFQVQPTPQQLQRGKALVNMMCADCHRDPSTGILSGKRLTDVPRVVGTLYAANITQHPELGIGTYTDAQLAYLLRTGVDRHGKLQPIMQKPGLTDTDLQAVIAFLQYSDDPLVKPTAVSSQKSRYSLPAKLAMPLMTKPLPYPTGAIEPASTQVAQGKYLVNVLGCYECHSKNMLKVNKLEPEKTKGYLAGGSKLTTLEGHAIRTPNLTLDEATGLKSWSQADFVNALRTGFRADHSVLRYPMPTYSELTEEEAAAIYAYLRTVPPVKNRVKRDYDTLLESIPAQDSLAIGAKVYAQYGCRSCHGQTGVGIADLRGADQKYPTDASLKARIQNPSAFDPASRMPRFEGIIAEQEYAPLLVYVRWLGRKNPQTAVKK